MNRIVIVLLLVIFGFTIFYLGILHMEQRGRLEELENENLILSEYISRLKTEIQENKVRGEISQNFDRTSHIRDLLDSYLSEKKKQDFTGLRELKTEELQEDLDNYLLKQRFIPDHIPLRGNFEISQGFSEKHKGIDFATKQGAEVVASGAGVIKEIYDDPFFGTVVIIDHLNNYLSFYGHLMRVFPQKNYFVEKGTTFALVGKSGFTQYPHLHFEIYYRGENINPDTLLVYN